MQQTNDRYEYIDFLRGIASIGIIAIHSAFWGGQSYTPEWFWNITLLLDVPFFFYLSGWGTSFHKSSVVKTCKSLGKIWFQWIYFIFCLALFCYISNYLPHQFAGVSDLRDLVNNFFFNVSFQGFPVVAGSIWYLPVYFVCILINSIIAAALKNHTLEKELCRTYMFLLAIIFAWVSYRGSFFVVNDLYFLFYSFFWMLGYNRLGKTESVKKLVGSLAIVIVGFCLSSYLLDLRLLDIQSAKFPPTMKYGFASMVVIFIAKYFDGKIKRFNKIFVHIGKNAIFYYFGQGIGSSLNFYVVNWIAISNWPLKWIITFIINILVTATIAEFMRVTWNTIKILPSCCKNRHW